MRQPFYQLLILLPLDGLCPQFRQVWLLREIKDRQFELWLLTSKGARAYSKAPGRCSSQAR
jgi:hypothetical protein